MALNYNTFNLQIALAGTPVGIPNPTAAVNTDEEAKFTGILNYIPSGGMTSYMTEINGSTIYVDNTGLVKSCSPENTNFVPDSTQLYIVDDTLVQTTGSTGNHTRHADDPQGGNANLSAMQPRDYFANQVLGMLIQKMDKPEAVSDAKIIFFCRAAYRWANGMMVAAANARYADQSGGGTSGEITVNPEDLTDNTERLLYNITQVLKKGVTVKGTTEQGTEPIQTKVTEVTEVKKITEITEVKNITEVTEIDKVTAMPTTTHVTVDNTPNVNIANQPSVIVANSPSVYVTNQLSEPVSVSVDNTPSVQVTNFPDAT